MQENLLSQLKVLLKRKQSNKYYGGILGITEQEVADLRKELKSQNINFLFVEGTEIPEGVITYGTFPNIENVENDHLTGDSKFIINSDKPLNPKEIEQLANVDNISSFVKTSWLKSHKNGTWTYSIQTINVIKDFYSTLELDEKLKEIFKDQDYVLNGIKTSNKKSLSKALFIYIADDHAGLVLKDSLYNKEYSGSTYENRLLQIVDEVENLGQVFSEIFVIRMGDEMDGYNGKTTRYDHSLDSLSNKEQFDIYTIANKNFYNSLFQTGAAVEYTIINLNNSNHTGLGFSYIANKALEFWMESRFPFVKIKQQTKFIDVVEFGNHIIGLVHGKDEKYMKAPMPLNLDFKTDLWLMEYYKQYILHDSFVSTVKADIHKYNVNCGKSGRYVNVPSISSGSNWIEHNFGDSQPGVLLEIYTKDSKNIISQPIWF